MCSGCARAHHLVPVSDRCTCRAEQSSQGERREPPSKLLAARPRHLFKQSHGVLEGEIKYKSQFCIATASGLSFRDPIFGWQFVLISGDLHSSALQPPRCHCNAGRCNRLPILSYVLLLAACLDLGGRRKLPKGSFHFLLFLPAPSPAWPLEVEGGSGEHPLLLCFTTPCHCFH